MNNRVVLLVLLALASASPVYAKGSLDQAFDNFSVGGKNVVGGAVTDQLVLTEFGEPRSKTEFSYNTGITKVWQYQAEDCTYNFSLKNPAEKPSWVVQGISKSCN